ncbi:MAG: murein L,D-transpeptidase family protein [Pseudomonadota bacterium]
MPQKSKLLRRTALACLFVLCGGYLFWRSTDAPVTWVDANPLAIGKALAASDDRLKSKGLTRGLPVYIRIIKQDSRLELWMEGKRGWTLYDHFPICRWSGTLGPKLREGDRQAPEGFYTVAISSLNPNSSNYLAFNLGFPNAFDRAHGRTGSYLMVHGDCRSIGCYAMTDPAIAVIYRLVEDALKNGQTGVPVHIFPFKMTEQNLHLHRASKWNLFWRQLQPAWQVFENSKVLPKIGVTGKRYNVARPQV